MSNFDQLDVALQQLYTGNANEASRKQIEQWLAQSFGYGAASTQTWQQGVQVLSNGVNRKSHFMQFFGLSLIEEVTRRHWFTPGIVNTTDERTGIKSKLFELLAPNVSSQLSAVVWNKVCKVIVDIARFEWPNQFPDLFDRVFALLQQQESTAIGLTLLRTLSEEFISDREDLPAARKAELRRNLLPHVPYIFDVLGQILDSYYSQLDTKHEICKLALQALMQYLSWVPLTSDNIKPNLLSVLFKYLSTQSGGGDVSNEALNCLNEILSKNYVPHELDPFLFQTFQAMVNILQQLTTQHNRTTFADIDSRFIEKVTLFVGNFVQNHIKRVDERQEQFAMPQFLMLLFRYTFLQSSHEEYTSCLDIWNTLLEYINTYKENKTTATVSQQQPLVDYNTILNRYAEALIALAAEELKRTMYLDPTYGNELIVNIDDIKQNPDGDTEFDTYLIEVMDSLALIGGLFPQPVLSRVETSLQQLLQQFHSSQPLPTITSNHMDLILAGEETSAAAPDLPTIKRVFCVCKDIRTHMRILGRLSELYLATDAPETSTNTVLTLLTLLMDITKFGLSSSLYQKGDAYIELIYEALSTIQMFAPWIVAYTANQTLEQFTAFITPFFELCFAILEHCNNSASLNLTLLPDAISKSASMLLFRLCASLKHKPLLGLSPIQQLVHRQPPVSERLSAQAQAYVYVGLAHAILNVPMAPSDAQFATEWESRKQVFSVFMDHLNFSLLHNAVTAANGDSRALQQLSNVLTIYHELATFAEDIPKHAKIAFQQALDSPIRQQQQQQQQQQHSVFSVLLQAFRTYTRFPAVLDEFLKVWIALFNSLKTQIGIPFIDQTITTFTDVLTVDSIRNILSGSNASSSGCRVMNSFLALLKALVSEGSNSLDNIMPVVIDIANNRVYNVISTMDWKQTIEIQGAFYDLQKSILLHKWRYFFGGGIGSSHDHPRDNVTNQQFQMILQTFLNALRTPDVTTVRNTLEHLNELNNTRKLYSRAVFVEVMLLPFLKVLLDILLSKSLNLLREEIIKAMYEMGFSSPEIRALFNSKFIPMYLADSRALQDQFKTQLGAAFASAGDLHSFMLTMNSFVNDFAYFTILSQPPSQT